MSMQKFDGSHPKISQTQMLHATRLCEQFLQDIRDALKPEVQGGKPYSIDEIAVMRICEGDNEGNIIFERTIGGRQLSSENLFQVLSSFFMNGNIIKTGGFTGLKGQNGEDFDFLVYIAFLGYEFFIFGNHIEGTLEDLEAHPNWEVAKAIFVTLAFKLGKLFHTVWIPQKKEFYKAAMRTFNGGFFWGFWLLW